MKMGKNGLELVKSFEGCYLNAYLCPAGVWTIGYGHTGKVDGKNIGRGMKITKKKAIKLLKNDMKEFENVVEKLVKVKLNQNQFDALVSFAFNCGAGSLQSSTLLKKLNAGDYNGASNEFIKWNKVTIDGRKVALDGLTKRRKAEKKLFCTGVKKKASIFTFKSFVKRLQKIKKKKVTGKANKELLESLPFISNKNGEKFPVIKPLKRYMKTLGYYNGVIDEVYTKELSDAIRQYKKAKDISDNSGFISKVFWKSILKL